MGRGVRSGAREGTPVRHKVKPEHQSKEKGAEKILTVGKHLNYRFFNKKSYAVHILS